MVALGKDTLITYICSRNRNNWCHSKSFFKNSIWRRINTFWSTVGVFIIWFVRLTDLFCWSVVMKTATSSCFSSFTSACLSSWPDSTHWLILLKIWKQYVHGLYVEFHHKNTKSCIVSIFTRHVYIKTNWMFNNEFIEKLSPWNLALTGMKGKLMQKVEMNISSQVRIEPRVLYIKIHHNDSTQSEQFKILCH